MKMEPRPQNMLEMTLTEVQVGTDPPRKCWIAKIEQPTVVDGLLDARSKFGDGYD